MTVSKNASAPAYINDVFKQDGYPNINTQLSFCKLNQPSLWKTNHRKKKLSHIALNIWNKLPDSLKATKDFVNT